ATSSKASTREPRSTVLRTMAPLPVSLVGQRLKLPRSRATSRRLNERNPPPSAASVKSRRAEHARRSPTQTSVTDSRAVEHPGALAIATPPRGRRHLQQARQ